MRYLWVIIALSVLVLGLTSCPKEDTGSQETVSVPADMNTPPEVTEPPAVPEAGDQNAVSADTPAPTDGEAVEGEGTEAGEGGEGAEPAPEGEGGEGEGGEGGEPAPEEPAPADPGTEGGE